MQLNPEYLGHLNKDLKGGRALPSSIEHWLPPQRVRGIRELIEGARVRSKSKTERTHAMLAEKFFLYLEALIESRKAHADGSPRVVSESPHVPIRLPAAQCKVPPTFKAGAGLHAGRLAP